MTISGTDFEHSAIWESEPESHVRQEVFQFLDRQAGGAYPNWPRWVGAEPCLHVVSKLRSNVAAYSRVTFKRYRRILGVLTVRNGPAFESNEALCAHASYLQKLARRLGKSLVLNPYIVGDGQSSDQILYELGFSRGSSLLGRYCATATVDLKDTREQNVLSFRSSMRRHIRKAERSDISILRMRSQTQCEQFERSLREFYQERSLGAVPAHMTLAGDPGGDGRVFAAVSIYEGRWSAGILVSRTGRRAIFEAGFQVTDSQGGASSRIPKSHLLHVAAMQWAVENEASLYDLGGYWEEAGAANPINRFKDGFAGRTQRVAGEYYWRPDWLSIIAARISTIGTRRTGVENVA